MKLYLICILKGGRLITSPSPTIRGVLQQVALVLLRPRVSRGSLRQVDLPGNAVRK